MNLTLWDEETPAATILTDDSPLCGLTYNSAWLRGRRGHPLSPFLSPAEIKRISAIEQNERIRKFLTNWLPEGRALDATASTLGISKASLFGLLIGLGQEMPGVFSIAAGPRPERLPSGQELRFLPHEELSRRISARQDVPFTVWDKKVRLSIAGYQDKLAVYEREHSWYLTNGHHVASTHILKPEPQSNLLAGMVSNEFFCMRLGARAGLPVASVSLHHVPDPILSIVRFDRKALPDGRVERIACIDGCQALNLAVNEKYERPYGDGAEVGHIRTGANLPAFFGLLGARFMTHALAAQLSFLRWVIFQVLIGNTDAHAKNISFFCERRNLRQAPAYDLVCGLAFTHDTLEDSLAMAIGDTFNPREIRAYDWAQMAFEAKISAAQVGIELQDLARSILASVEPTRTQVILEGADPAMVDRVSEIVTTQCEQALKDAPRIRQVDPSLFAAD